MTASYSIFYIFAFLIVVSSAASVLLPNILYAGFSLFGAFFGIAVMYVLLGADFVAGSQVLIYVGGILTLILFAVMLSKNIYSVSFQDEKQRRIIPAIVSLVVFGLLCKVIFSINWNLLSIGDEPAATTKRIGTLLLTDYLLPFELASILLLAALIGAIVLARRDV